VTDVTHSALGAGYGERTVSHSRRSLAILGLFLCSVLTGGSAQAADVPQPDAQQLGDARTGMIGGPADPHWYVLPGGSNGSAGGVNIFITIVSVPAACGAAQPLSVREYSPEGHLIRRLAADARGDFSPPIPALPGRYLLKLSVDDPACAPLTFGIAVVGYGNGENYNGAVDACIGLRANVTGATLRLRHMRAQTRRVSADARPRYRMLVHMRERELADAVAIYQRNCPQHA
jgi:hypothetical protein